MALAILLLMMVLGKPGVIIAYIGSSSMQLLYKRGRIISISLKTKFNLQSVLHKTVGGGGDS